MVSRAHTVGRKARTGIVPATALSGRGRRQATCLFCRLGNTKQGHLPFWAFQQEGVRLGLEPTHPACSIFALPAPHPALRCC